MLQILLSNDYWMNLFNSVCSLLIPFEHYFKEGVFTPMNISDNILWISNYWLKWLNFLNDISSGHHMSYISTTTSKPERDSRHSSDSDFSDCRRCKIISSIANISKCIGCFSSFMHIMDHIFEMKIYKVQTFWWIIWNIQVNFDNYSNGN